MTHTHIKRDTFENKINNGITYFNLNETGGEWE